MSFSIRCSKVVFCIAWTYSSIYFFKYRTGKKGSVNSQIKVINRKIVNGINGMLTLHA